MKPDKVAQRKNKPRKPKVVKTISEQTVDSSPRSDTSSECKDYDCDIVENDVKTLDICDIAESCVLEEMINNVRMEDIEVIETEGSPLSYQILPSNNLTIYEEFKICEMEATKDLVYKSLVDTLKAALPNFGYCTYKLLISLVTGKKIELTTEKMLKFFNRMRLVPTEVVSMSHYIYESNVFREVVYFDLINGGSICNALDSIELFKNIPSDLKFEIFQSSFGVVEMCVRYNI